MSTDIIIFHGQPTTHSSQNLVVTTPISPEIDAYQCEVMFLTSILENLFLFIFDFPTWNMRCLFRSDLKYLLPDGEN